MDLNGTGRVYVVQRQRRWDDKVQDYVEKFDLSTAEQYGDIDFLLSPTAAPFNNKSILNDLRHKLTHYTDDDYLLLIGNPCLIGWTVALAAYYNKGHVKLLQWSGRDRKYIEIDSKLFDMNLTLHSTSFEGN